MGKKTGPATNWQGAVFLFGLLLMSASPATATRHEEGQAHITAGLAAEEAGRFDEAITELEAALALRPNHPGLHFMLAQVQAEAKNKTGVLAHLEHYAAMGLTANLERVAVFDPLRETPAFKEVAERIRKNAEPMGSPKVTRTGATPANLTEGIAYDQARDRWFVSAIHDRRILALDPDGSQGIFAERTSGLLSPMGMRVDEARGLLWVAAAATPQSEGLGEADQGRSELRAFDLSTGKEKGFWPAPEGKHWFGDLLLLPDGTPLLSDSLTNTLYHLPDLAGSLEPFLSHDDFVSPQGVTLSVDGRILFLADYAMGLFRIDLETLTVKQITPSDTFTPYGIDGLYTYKGDLIAIQNGVRPKRVMRIHLNADQSAVTGYKVLAQADPRFLEPTLGEVSGDRVHFLANSNWPLFDPMPEDLGALQEKLAPPLILHVDLAE